MSLGAGDILKIKEVIALHAHLCDAAVYERFNEVFTPDLEVDVSDLGLRQLPPGDPSRSRLDAYITASRDRGAGEVLSLHVTNTIIREEGTGARAFSKGFTLHRDGSVASFVYEDQLVRVEQSWRIRRRKVSPRREPGQAAEPFMLQN